MDALTKRLVLSRDQFHGWAGFQNDQRRTIDGVSSVWLYDEDLDEYGWAEVEVTG